MLIYDDFSRTSNAKTFYFLFESFLSYLVCVPGFKSINSSSLSRKKYDGDNFTPIIYNQLGGQIHLWEHD